MAWVPDRYRELRSLLRPDRIEDEVDEELLLHVELRAADLEAEGLPAAEAREEAWRRFGDLAAFRGQTCDIEREIRREQRRMEIMDAVRREGRQALRSLRRAPLFTAVAVLTLGLGIGATTAIFTLIDSIVLRPLPYPAPDRLVQLQHAVPKVGPDQKWGNSVASYFFYGDRNEAFEELGAYSSGTFSLSGDGTAERVDGAAVSASLLRVLDVRAARGRLFTDEEDVPGGASVVLISHELWHSRYGGDPQILGRTIHLNASPYTVIGVVEAGTRLPLSPVQVWLPMRLDRSAPPVNSHWVSVYARMKAGVTPDAAQRDLQRLASLMPDELPEAYSVAWYESSGFTPAVTPLRAQVLGRIEGVLWILLGAVSLVLLIAGANVANLYIVRYEVRRREQTVRAALGADRAHFAVQHLTESTAIGLAAAAVGVLLTYAGVRLLVVLSPPGVPRLHEVSVSAASIAVAAGLALLTALVFGLAPTLRGRSDFSQLRESGRGMTASRERQLARRLLVIAQVALALVLLMGGGLMLQSFINLRGVETGIDPDGVLTFQVFPPSVRYPTRDEQLRLRREITDRIMALPGVSHVSAATQLPLDGSSGCSYTTVEGTVYSSSERPPCMPMVHVLPGYFETLGVDVAGETLSWSDFDRRRGVAVVSRAFADRMWPGEDPIGKGVISYQDGPPWYRVIGVADDVRAAGVDRAPIEVVYYPPYPMEGACCAGSAPTSFVVRASTAGELSLAESIRGIVSSLDPEIPLAQVRTMNQMINASEAVARGSFTLILLALAAMVALFLSAVGLYGVIAYLVGRRRSEIGVRMALGARVGEVVRLVMLQSVALAGIGIVIGVIAALMTTRVLESLLFEVQPGDVRILLFVSLILLLVAVIASLVPARRAARTDPSEALRAD